MNDAQKVPCLINENRRLARSLRKEQEVKRRLLNLLQHGQRSAAVALLEKHLREVGELDRG